MTADTKNDSIGINWLTGLVIVIVVNITIRFGGPAIRELFGQVPPMTKAEAAAKFAESSRDDAATETTTSEISAKAGFLNLNVDQMLSERAVEILQRPVPTIHEGTTHDAWK